MKSGDVFILDRGFRDIVDTLKEKGYMVLMPSLKGKRNQLTAEESNYSRFVTKLRWVVESVHGIIAQKYRLLHNQFRNNMLQNAGLYCKIANCLQNLFGKRLNIMDDDKTRIIIERMKHKKSNVNALAEKISADNLNRKSVPFEEMSSEKVLDFPELTLEDLEIFFTGSYQLAQAISYLGEMLQEDGTLPLKVLKNERGILRFEVRSRHINARTYKCYVQYDKDVGIAAIEGHCCTCANGLRTVGCCSHVASLIYHLSYGRYLSRVIRPAQMLTNIFDIENMCPVIDEDSDED